MLKTLLKLILKSFFLNLNKSKICITVLSLFNDIQLTQAAWKIFPFAFLQMCMLTNSLAYVTMKLFESQNNFKISIDDVFILVS